MRTDRLQNLNEDGAGEEHTTPSQDTEAVKLSDTTTGKRLSAIEAEIAYLRRAVGEIDKAVTTLLRQPGQR